MGKVPQVSSAVRKLTIDEDLLLILDTSPGGLQSAVKGRTTLTQWPTPRRGVGLFITL
jgi:hypothetical protein